MIFRSGSNLQTRIADQNGIASSYWGDWFRAVAQWLQEASRVNSTGGALWVQQGPIVFLDYAGTDPVTLQIGAGKGLLPKPQADTFLTALSGASLPLLASATELNLTGPAKGWYIAKEGN
jgi:hypothetical protein